MVHVYTIIGCDVCKKWNKTNACHIRKEQRGYDSSALCGEKQHGGTFSSAEHNDVSLCLECRKIYEKKVFGHIEWDGAVCVECRKIKERNRFLETIESWK